MGPRMATFCTALVVCATGVAPAWSQASAGDECFKLEGHEKQHECLDTQARQSAQAVNDIEAKVLEDINSWNQDTVYLFQTSSDLAASTKFFEQYRNSQCELHASLAGGGSSSVDRRLVCEIAMNEKRLEDLKKIDGELKYWKKE